jgi:hypothetical protein
MKKKTLFSVLCWLLVTGIFAQHKDIPLINGSFEGKSGPGQVPEGWFDCGFEAETPPDLHPSAVFDIGLDAQDGETFLGMVARDNGSWEGLGQKLTAPLLENQCYTLSFYAARSETLVSLSRVTDEIVNYNIPTVLQIWGGYDECDQRELLGESFAIESPAWERYEFVLFPSDTFTHISIEVFYQREYTETYNGNVLLDNFSNFIAIPCDSAVTMIAGESLPDSVDISLQKVTVLPDSSATRLEEVILESATQIRFAPDNTLQTSFFENAEGQLVDQNRAIYKIGVVAAGLPDVKLKFALFAYSEVGFNKRKQKVLSALEALGVAPSQVTIIWQETAAPTETWLWKEEAAEAWVKILE